ncbi:TolC family protein [Rhizobacter sp. Root404]|uniref:TolC family protein n=1 Tax=Rhizobacter sp. Root404 TaxID=1736528 RepID=UPI0007015D4D|nr:TolC family protein [Rhizobacter sp. Root404]KQW37529.1 RND transporter [Rhizobacter sp. Root404]
MLRLTATALAALVLGGCASFSPDGGFDQVAQLTRERIGQAPVYQRTGEPAETTRARIAALLAQPLDADSAVELALLNNRALQASYAELGIAEAEFVRAGRLANPRFTFGRLSGGGGVEIDRAVMFDVLSLFAMPWARQVEQRRFEQTQYQAAFDTVGVAGEARQAFFEAACAQELVVYFEQVKDAADASNELARRMVAAGNFSALAQMREQSFYADATARLARARHQAVAARERLSRVLALSGDQLAFRLPERLPDLPAAPADLRDAEQVAMDKRLDVLMARRATEATARSLGLSRATRFVNVLDVGYQNQSQTGEPRKNGYEIELELPLFDFGTTRVARAESTYLQSLHRTAQIALNARSEVRESYSAYRTAYDLAKHYRDEVVPLRQRISDENLLRYNGMLLSVFDLLADARDQVASVTGAVEALRDYWIAETQLQAALTGRSPVSAPTNRGAGADAPSARPAAH